MTAEYVVERSRSLETIRPDIVLFVNGIPFGVIECKAPDVGVEDAVSQNIRNQGNEYIPRLFHYVQLVMGVNKNEARYGTAGTPNKFWSVWKELEYADDEIAKVVNAPLTGKVKDALFTGGFASAREFFDALEAGGGRLLTEQDKAIYSLCRPERLLDMTYRFIVFEHREKKIARYQQFFVVRRVMDRIRRRDRDGNRTGGMIWHTQGSGKSLTMVMLARALVLDKGLVNPRIILVTDRDDLDKQLGDTFVDCGLSRKRARSGRDLVRHLQNKVGIITTLIHKFDKGWVAEDYVDESPDVFVLVDESHRTNFGTLAARMRRMLPHSCYLGFTGTPLMKEEKNNFARFGGLIEPHYSIRQAVKDKAVLPLLYEGRHVEMEQNQQAIDLWFQRHTADLTEAQRADLKRKYARAEVLNRSGQVIYMRAFDISEHYRKNWQGTGFKAQLVAPDKVAALRYHEALKEIDVVTSEVVISAPDTREGHDEVDGVPAKIIDFWGRMMGRFGSEGEYNRNIIERFKNSDEPEILIVVDKLLTGFDAPRNTVLYLCKRIKEHTLLQAIARVNRLYEGKEFGYIVDYVSVLGELDKALTMYEAFEGFDETDMEGALNSVNEEVRQLSQRHSDLWDVFRGVSNRHDEEAFEVHLAAPDVREEFYERLYRYSKTLGIALSTDRFIRETDESEIGMYKDDLKLFQRIKVAVRRRYAESVDYRDMEPRIRKILDTHIQANEVLQLNEPVDILDNRSVEAVMQASPTYGGSITTEAKADIIAHATRKYIVEKMEEDPAFYEKFSALIQQAIDDFREQRLFGQDYLDRVRDIREKVISGHRDNVPESISNNDEACAYYGLGRLYFQKRDRDVDDETLVEMALKFQQALEKERVVDFWNNQNAINEVKRHFDDFFFDHLQQRCGIELTTEEMDEITGKILKIAKNRWK